MLAATMAELVPNVRFLGLSFRLFCCMDVDGWRTSGLDTAVVVVWVMIGAGRGGVGRDRECVWEMGTVGNGRGRIVPVAFPLPLHFVSVGSSGIGEYGVRVTCPMEDSE